MRINARSAATQIHISRTAIRYEDLRYLPLNLARAEARPAADEKLGDREVAVVELGLPAGVESSYERIVAWVDRDTCVPLKIEFWETGGKRRKTLHADPDTIRKTGTTQLAHTLHVEDHIRDIQTDVLVEKSLIDSELPGRLFTPPLRPGTCPGGPP